MNLNEERNYQKLMDALDAMGLDGENRRIAEEYFQPGSQENTEILSRIKRQDFYKLPEEARIKCADYAEHLKKRGRGEELARYVRFAAAAGGSTACYVLTRYAYSSWSIKGLLEYMTPAQSMAAQAELTVWNVHALTWTNLRELQKETAQNPQAALEAMELCCNQYANAKVLRAALYL